MAVTPPFRVQSVAVNVPIVFTGQAISVFFPTINNAGAAVDVSAGYVIQRMPTRPQSNANQLQNIIDLSGHASFAYGATGVTMTLTQAQGAYWASALACKNTNFALNISSDAGTTECTIAQGVITLQDFGVNVQ
jgi:hypothetical protein